MKTEHRKITLRLSEKLYGDLKCVSSPIGRSITEEINLRLESSFNDESVESTIAKIESLLSSLKRTLKPSEIRKNPNQDSNLLTLIKKLDDEKKNILKKFISSLN